MITGLLAIFNIKVILFIFLGTTLGITIGALPGLSATMGVALLIPLTFKLDALVGLAMLGGIYCGATYGGSISAILVGIPGTPAAIATTLDGYPMTKKGEGKKALAFSVISSFIGGIFSAAMLLIFAPKLARISLKFGSPEMLILALLGLTLISSLSGRSVVKGLIAGGIGLVLSTTGVDPYVGGLRFTFNNPNLYSGFNMIVVLIGIFCIPAVMSNFEESFSIKRFSLKMAEELKGFVIIPLSEIFKIFKLSIRCSLIGTIIGSIPGTGSDIAAFLGYNEAKRTSKNPEKFGTGIPEGIVGPESANNGVTGGSLIPLLTLGIPGNAVSAVLLGGLLIQGLVPGFELFSNSPRISYGFIFSLFIANAIFLVLGLTVVKYFIKAVELPLDITLPIIVILSMVGAFAIQNNPYDTKLVLIFGLLAYLSKKTINMPLAPLIIALILGPIAERSLGQTLVMANARNIPLIIFILSRPICIILIIVIAFLLYTALRILKQMRKLEMEE